MQITKDFYRDTDLRITVLRSTYLIAALYIEHTLGMSPCERERERERDNKRRNDDKVREEGYYWPDNFVK